MNRDENVQLQNADAGAPQNRNGTPILEKKDDSSISEILFFVLAEHLLGSLWFTSTFCEVPHVSRAVGEGLLCPPLELALCSPDLSYTEAYITSSSTNLTDGYCTARCNLQTLKNFTNSVSSSSAFDLLANLSQTMGSVHIVHCSIGKPYQGCKL
jgi:hypothetical protein